MTAGRYSNLIKQKSGVEFAQADPEIKGDTPIHPVGTSPATKPTSSSGKKNNRSQDSRTPQPLGQNPLMNKPTPEECDMSGFRGATNTSSDDSSKASNTVGGTTVHGDGSVTCPIPNRIKGPGLFG